MDEDLSEYFDIVEAEESSETFHVPEATLVNSEIKQYKENEENPKYFCQACNKKFIDQNSLIRHNFGHAGDKYQCSFCDFKSGLVLDIEKHHRIEHPNIVLKLNCPNCEYFCSSKHGLRDHMKYDHSERSFKCDDCKYETKRPGNLKAHKAHMHTIREKDSCPECDKSFNSRMQLGKHFRYIHRKNAKTYLCTNCDFETKYRFYLVKHMSESLCKRTNKERLAIWNQATWLKEELIRNGENQIMEELYSHNRVSWMQKVLNGEVLP